MREPLTRLKRTSFVSPSPTESRPPRLKMNVLRAPPGARTQTPPRCLVSSGEVAPRTFGVQGSSPSRVVAAPARCDPGRGSEAADCARCAARRCIVPRRWSYAALSEPPRRSGDPPTCPIEKCRCATSCAASGNVVAQSRRDGRCHDRDAMRRASAPSAGLSDCSSSRRAPASAAESLENVVASHRSKGCAKLSDPERDAGNGADTGLDKERAAAARADAGRAFSTARPFSGLPVASAAAAIDVPGNTGSSCAAGRCRNVVSWSLSKCISCTQSASRARFESTDVARSRVSSRTAAPAGKPAAASSGLAILTKTRSAALATTPQASTSTETLRRTRSAPAACRGIGSSNARLAEHAFATSTR
mmetsp:Transcript_1625/g.5750  ORF Transcript_1625/g.5750 Transcript_1625/m.5750 type:complete len:362 (+) Transcript_1625:1823-2908(+)